jgi:hypothetical protein
METINIQQHIHVLRSELLAMARLTQRAVDYSIRAYQLGRPEFCRHASNTDDEVQITHRFPDSDETTGSNPNLTRRIDTPEGRRY